MPERSELAALEAPGTAPSGESTSPELRDLARSARVVSWRSFALLPVVVLATILIWVNNDAPPIEVVAAASVDDPAPLVRALPTLAEEPPATEPTATEEAAAAEPTLALETPTPPALPAAAAGGPVHVSQAVVPAPATAPVVRVRIPALSVDAPVQSMGLDAAGTMEVPYSAAAVAWYGFTAVPGSAGNAVMSGHVDWKGAIAVFHGLRTLKAGDLIEVTTSAGTLRYSVERTYLVRPEEADIAEIVGQRQGRETLTLITCGGTFDRTAHEYDHRVIVRATRA